VNYYSNKHYWEDQFLLGHVQGLCWLPTPETLKLRSSRAPSRLNNNLYWIMQLNNRLDV